MFRDFPGGPVVKTLPSNAGVVDFIPGSVFGGGANIPYVWRPKNENKSNSKTITNSIEILKMVHIKKS